MNIWERSLIAALVIAIIGVVVFQFINWQSRTKATCQKEREKERQQWEKVVTELEAQIAGSSRVPTAEPGVPPADAPSFEMPADLFDEGIALVAEAEPPSCGDLAEWISGFFDYLDGQEYLTALNLENGTLAKYNQVMKSLSASPPAVTEMVLNFDRVLQNIIYFYRILGESNLKKAKTVIDHEAENIEAILSVFYAYTTLCGEVQDAHIFVPSVETRYEYAGFFLNTIGGRSYLYRRDSRTRILLTYYAVLTLHEANKKVLNQYGIDLVPFLEPLASEIAARTDLVLKEEYLATLEDLIVTYAAARAWSGEEAGN